MIKPFHHNSSFWNLIFGGIGVLISIFLLLFYSNIENVNDDSSVRTLFQSVEFKICSGTLLATSYPLILDVIVNTFTTTSQSETFVQCTFALTSFIIGLMFMLYMDNFHQHKSFMTTYWTIEFCRRISLVSIIMFRLSVLKKNVSIVRETIIATGFFISIHVLCLYKILYARDINFDDFRSMGLCSLLCIILACKWTYLHMRTNNIKVWNISDYYFVLYLSLCFIVTVFYFLESVVFMQSETNALNPKLLILVMPTCMHIVVTVIICVVPNQIARLEIATIKDQVIAANAAHTRYIAHELRTPINSVHIGLRLCINEIPENITDLAEKRRRQTLVEISTANEVSLEILNDMLLYGKLKNDLVTLNKSDVNVLDFISKYLTMFEIQIRANNIKLALINKGCQSIDDSNERVATSRSTIEDDNISVVTNYSSKSTISFNTSDAFMNGEDGSDDIIGETIMNTDTISVDKSKLGQVLRNLMSNAIKFTPSDGTITLTIKYSSTDSSDLGSLKPTSNGMLVMEVKDSGAGISPENQKRLFKEIIQFNPEELQDGGGSGLGLWISKAIVDMHGGCISVHSEGEGKGSTFRLEIPMTR